MCGIQTNPNHGTLSFEIVPMSDVVFATAQTGGSAAPRAMLKECGYAANNNIEWSSARST
jgi:hypothetical protein